MSKSSLSKPTAESGSTQVSSGRTIGATTAAPLSLQRKLTVNTPGDKYEQEADRVAEQVMRMPALPLQRQCSCGKSSSGGKCEECKKKKRVASSFLQREATSANGAFAAPPIVSEVLSSTGSPLPESTRIFMESRFGQDFSQVKVHTDKRAAESAAAIQAQAYTVGSNIVFGRGVHPSQDHHLLAHELTHVLQQSTSSSMSHSIQRRGPMPVPPAVRPGPVRPGPSVPLTETIPGRAGAPSGTYSEPIWVPEQYDDSLDAAFQRANIRDHAERTRMEQERPVATLTTGGTAPHFISENGTREYSWIGGPSGGGTVTVRKREFHILDAVGYRVLQAQDNKELLQVLYDLIPEAASKLRNGQQHTLPLPRLFTFPSDIPRIPSNLDPGGLVRFNRFLTAVKLKELGTATDLRRQPLPAEFADILMIEKVEKKTGACNARPIPRSGGNAPHNRYADAVTGSLTDFRIDTPEGISAETDGLDAQGVTWEVKTLHKYLTDLGMAQQFARGGATFRQIVSRLEEQRARGVFVTARCGYRYIWAVQYKEVAEFLNSMWGGLPPVFCRKADGSTC